MNKQSSGWLTSDSLKQLQGNKDAVPTILWNLSRSSIKSPALEYI